MRKNNKRFTASNKILLFLNLITAGLLLFTLTIPEVSDLWESSFFKLGYKLMIILNVVILITWLFKRASLSLISFVSILIASSSIAENLNLSQNYKSLFNINTSSGKAKEHVKLQDRTKPAILNYMLQIIKHDQILVGQHLGNGYEVQKGYDNFVERLNTLTLKYPALIGLEYGYSKNSDFDFMQINQTAIDFWKKGGLVTISWHVDNPWLGGYNSRWNSIVFKNQINFKQLLADAPESPAKQSYRTELTRIGNQLKNLQQNGVTVLWRPLHEMNETWFWWGVNDKLNPTNVNDFIMLWKDMHNYLTKTLKLDNLIWIYSPNASENQSSIIRQYPGSDFVDVVGIDTYGNKPEFDNYNTLLKFNKPIVIAEIGPRKDGYGNYNELDALNVYKGKAAYFLQWSGWKNAKVAIVDNLHYKEMITDDSAITLDKLK